jgi:hypothetical protein
VPDTTKTVTILAGQSLSDAFDASSALQLFIVTPADWTGANVTMQLSVDGGANFHDFFTPLGEETLFGMQGRLDSINFVDISDLPKSAQLKLRSGTRSNPVPQKADRVFKIVVVT